MNRQEFEELELQVQQSGLPFQNLCSITKYMACMHINRLLSECKLKNIGYRNHPVYMAVPGNFGVTRE